MTNYKQFYDQAFKLGILGGGQLGRMMIQSCADFNIKPAVLDKDRSVPAAQISTYFLEGYFQEYDDVLALGDQSDLLTIEIEHVNIEALKTLVERGVPVYPQPEVLEIIQDKGRQKQLYTDLKIPTADFALIKTQAEIYQYEHLFPVFQKTRRAGYDGKGVQKIEEPAQIPSGFDAPSLLEKAVDCEKELSVIVARNTKGEVATYPPTEMLFYPDQNLVDMLISPADISNQLADQAQSIAKDVAEKLEVVGLLAVELFLSKDGEVLVNEVAPRPHNSGHHSIEANVTSQFEQHLRAIMGMPLGSTAIIAPAVMVNLVGEPEERGTPYYEGLEKVLAMDHTHVHIYGKPETKPFRKMGHVTIVAGTAKEARTKAQTVKATLKVKANG